ncbi:MAG TPA: ribbon-helix-helix domain-containing protein [Ramlibacter sp.]|uniref:ribbon-helix-helix domain-containing protein n=1 Tax=Ramlibacter sp. TaxID=1917967 RepID=UPI002B963D2F|nr:ribbon-helix-helix domain-containing protein [Ramlibacter sp.]HVZ45109.1 ribbon-helix-helix domain-containing protein [Ramlibacter sp.]
MTLTVRLPEPLEDALEKYSASHGVTKSHVVQEALAAYIVSSAGTGKKLGDGKVSDTYRALKKAGLIGCFSGDGVSATKDVVRRKILERLKRPR